MIIDFILLIIELLFLLIFKNIEGSLFTSFYYTSNFLPINIIEHIVVSLFLMSFTRIIFLFCKNCSEYFADKYKILKDIFLLILSLTAFYFYIGVIEYIKSYQINAYRFALTMLCSNLFVIFSSFFFYNVFDKKKKILYMAFLISIIFVGFLDFIRFDSVLFVPEWGAVQNVIFILIDLTFPILLSILLTKVKTRLTEKKIKNGIIINFILTVISIIIICIYATYITSPNILKDIEVLTKPQTIDNLAQDAKENLKEKVRNNNEEKINVETFGKNSTPIKDVKYNNIKIGDIIKFGNYRYHDEIKDHEWIVLDKNDNDKTLLLLSKGGLGTERGSAAYQYLLNRDYYHGDDTDSDGNPMYDIKYEELKEEPKYKNTTLRYDFYQKYRDFTGIYLSKDTDEYYNEYRFKDNIVKTHLDDTGTDDYFFPLSKKEYEKYKMIKGVGDYYRRIDNVDVIFSEGQEVVWPLRDIVKGGKQVAEYASWSLDWQFACVDTGITYANYDFDEMNGYKLRDAERKVGEISDFMTKFNYSAWQHEWDHDFISIDIRPAMRYKCIE